MKKTVQTPQAEASGVTCCCDTFGSGIFSFSSAHLHPLRSLL